MNDDARTTPPAARPSRDRLAQRAAAVVTEYIHEISERHGTARSDAASNSEEEG